MRSCFIHGGTGRAVLGAEVLPMFEYHFFYLFMIIRMPVIIILKPLVFLIRTHYYVIVKLVSVGRRD